VGVLITFSPEFSKQFGIEGQINAGTAVMFCYIGLAAGDFLSGSLSQIFKTRRKVIEGFIVFTLIMILVYLFLNRYNTFFFYTVCLMLGVSGGYWAVFVMNASEQFGTNIRATVTTTVPNFVRGSVVPATLLFQLLSNYIGIIYSALVVGMLTVLIAYLSVKKLEETYGKDLNFLEVL
jgi:MFS family permease